MKENLKIYLKKVILENFLSFQRDEIDFSGDTSSDFPRLILIIGPNWSGKTSIFQAIKFALGSNERDERYKKWSDFIRDGQNHAMVELHFLFNTELIKIRRIVLRGKAPYYEIQTKEHKKFQKTNAYRLQNLIASFKINPDNHFAFVSQGKIDAIKTLKAIELCNFIEEGIGLKDLREEILHQKNSVYKLKNDFESLVTKKNTLNFNLEILKPKLKRLEEKQKLIKEKQVHLDELLWANKEKLQEQIEILEGNVKASRKIIQHLQTDINNQLVQIDKIQTEISTVEEDISKIIFEKGELSFQKKEFLNQIQTWQDEKLKAKEELDQFSQKVVNKEKEFNNLDNQKKKLALEIESISNEEKLVKEKINEIITSQDELTKKVHENQEFLNRYNDLSTEKENLIKTLNHNKESIVNTEKDINDIFQSLQDIDHKLESNKWFLNNPTKDLMKQFDNELKNSTTRLLDIKIEYEKLDHERKINSSRIKELQKALNERKIILPANINVLKEEIIKRGLDDKVKGPIIDFLSYDDELSYAIESVLGEKLLHSFIAMDWDTLNLFRKIKQKFNAYCNIYLPKNVPISSFSEIGAPGALGYLAKLIKVLNNDLDVIKVIYSKIKNCIVVKDYLSGRNLYTSHNFNGKCVTLKGEQIVSYKYVYESPYTKRLKGLLSAGTQKEQLELSENELDKQNSKINKLRVEQTELDDIQREIYKKKEVLNDLLYSYTQKQRLTEKKNQLYNSIYNLEQSNSSLIQKITNIDKNLGELKKQKEPNFFKWNERLKEIPGELNKLQNILNNWDLKLTEKRQNIQEVNDKLIIAGNTLSTIQNEFKIKKSNFKKLDKRAFDLYKKLEQIDEKLENIENLLNKVKVHKSELNREKIKFDNYHLELKFSLEQENINFNSLEHELKQKKEDLERVYENITKLNLDMMISVRPIEEIQRDIVVIDKKLLKYYDVDESILIEKEQITKTLKNIIKNQQKLETDIKAALKTEIKLEETYYNKFKLALEDLNYKINKKFDDANIKAFCSLALINNFEDLGIEIKAATTKDQLKTCTALSGGQISMISINIILSLQEIKPSPLCMFDEAGMFLDEKNSEVSYHMIKSTLDKNPVQLLMFLPKSSNTLYKLADKLIGVARVGKKETSTIFVPKVVRN
ncbi:MAG: AAA family ATPase [Candidatus Thorarchaeota archaeon]